MTQALLVIDVQRGLFDPEPRPYEADAVVHRINTLTAAARAAATPVVFIQHERAGSPLAHGGDDWQLEKTLVVDEHDVIVRKTTPDSFLRTDLDTHLAKWGANQLVICGYASEFCVDTTVRRAAALGYGVILVADAHTTHDKPHASAQTIQTHHNATLAAITSFGPEIATLSTSEVIFS